MHELQFLTNLVRMVEDICQKQPGISPSVIKLQIASYSHLAEHTAKDLQSMFDFVSRDTVAQDAKLDIIPTRVTATYQACGTTLTCNGETFSCPICGSGEIDREDTPEVLLKEITYVESHR